MSHTLLLLLLTTVSGRLGSAIQGVHHSQIIKARDDVLRVILTLFRNGEPQERLAATFMNTGFGIVF